MMELLFTLDGRNHGKSPIIYSWHPSSCYVASVGGSRTIFICDRLGNIFEEITVPNMAQCLGLEWDRTGRTLAILQGGSNPEVVLWDFKTKELEFVAAAIKDPSFKGPTYMKWSKQNDQLAIGTMTGDLLMYDSQSKFCWYVVARHKKRISCGAWNSENKFAFASDDRQITIATSDGKTFGQVKVKSKPTSVEFGGNSPNRENIVSVSMDKKTILLYNLDDPENALELAFQQRYGHIIAFKWFRDGYIMVGFSLGYLVVISTHLAEIGREQFCARFHKDNLRDIAYCPDKHLVATCGDNCIKIVDMNDWKELMTKELDKSMGMGGPLDRLYWTQDGDLLSVSSRNGCLHVFSVEATNEEELVEGSASQLLHQTLQSFTPLSMVISGLIVFCLVIFGFSVLFDVPVSYVLQSLLGINDFFV